MTMLPPLLPKPTDEDARLACLLAYDILGTSPEAEFDHFVELAAKVFEVPICMIALIGENEQWLKARWGTDADSTGREISFCTYTILTSDPLVVFDATTDERFRDNPSVQGSPHVRFYAGAPLINREGVRLGAFCIIDRAAREDFNEIERSMLVAFARVVSERLDARRLARKNVAVGSFAEATGMAIVTANSAGMITFWNDAARKLFGYDHTDVLGRPLDLIIPARFQAGHHAALARLSVGGASSLAGRSVEVVAVDRNGREFPIELAIAVWKGRRGPEFGAHIQDISARRAREADLHHRAHHDGLTGLLNRSGFKSAVEERLKDRSEATVLVLDLDCFKSVNDTLGHAVGDALLQSIGIRMTACVGGGGLLGRVGGDEFALLLSRDNDLAAAEMFANHLLEAFSDPFRVAGHDLHVGTSIGIAAAPLHAANGDELLLRADLALLRSKSEGGNTLRIFDAAMGNQLAARRAFKDELRQACVNRQWELFYQPQVSLPDGRLIGAEALLRWRHPTRGLLLPAVFMPVLETHLLAYEVGRRTIDEACRQLAAWRRDGLTIDRMSVNLFSAQLRAGTLEKVVSAALERHALHPSSLELEVTETIVLGHDDSVLGQLNVLHDLGVGISFDDFGTGFASLSSLKRFPLTRLKVDRSFVDDVCTEDHSRAIVRAVAAMGHGLGLQVIAEGIETAEQERAVALLGCQEGQGYLYGRPMDACTFAMRYSEPQHRYA